MKKFLFCLFLVFIAFSTISDAKVEIYVVCDYCGKEVLEHLDVIIYWNENPHFETTSVNVVRGQYCSTQCVKYAFEMASAELPGRIAEAKRERAQKAQAENRLP